MQAAAGGDGTRQRNATCVPPRFDWRYARLTIPSTRRAPLPPPVPCTVREALPREDPRRLSHPRDAEILWLLGFGSLCEHIEKELFIEPSQFAIGRNGEEFISEVHEHALPIRCPRRARLGSFHSDAERPAEKAIDQFSSIFHHLGAQDRGWALAAPTLSTNTMMNDMPAHSRLYMDIIAMAFACNITRVASTMLGGGQNDEPIKFGNINMSNWHSVSHGDPDGVPGQQMINLEAYLAGEFLYFIQKLKSFSDGAGTVLDNTAAVFATQNGSSQNGLTGNFKATDHFPQHAPFVVAGSCGGAWTTGRLIDLGGRYQNDVYLSIVQSDRDEVTTVGQASWCKGPAIV